MKIKSFADTGEKRMLLRRIIVYSIAIFIIGVLQCAFFARLSPFGATPDITLGAVCAIVMLDNKRAGAVAAVAGGYFIDALGSLPPSFTPIFYLAAVVLIGSLIDKMMPAFASFAVSMLAAAAFGAAYTWINLWIHLGALPSFSSLWQLLLPYMLSTVVCSLPVYFAIKLCTRIIEVNRVRN